VIYGLFYDQIGWRGMLWIGVLRRCRSCGSVLRQEPPVWVENGGQQRPKA